MNFGYLISGTNKVFAFSFELGYDRPFWLQFKWSTEEDHAGLGLELNIYKLFQFEIAIHDRRHWDREQNCWHSDKTWKIDIKQNRLEDIKYAQEQIKYYADQIKDREAGITEKCWSKEKTCEEPTSIEG